MANFEKKAILTVILGILLLALDRVSKCFILRNPDLYSNNLFKLKLIENKGFYFLSFDPSLLITVVLLLFFALFIFAFKKKDLGLMLGFSLIIIGGVSNLLDRLVFGYVVDWIRVFLFPVSVFNLADLIIITGIVILGFSTAKAYKLDNKRYNSINKRS